MNNDLRSDAEKRHQAGVWDLSSVIHPLDLGPLGYISYLLGRIALRGSFEPRVDIGGGDGRFGDLVLGRNHHLMDVSQTALSKSQPGNQSVQGDITALPYATASFGGILASDVLEHLPPQQAPKALNELTRILKPGGILSLNTSCFGFYLRRLGNLMRGDKSRLDKFDKADGHLNRFKASEISAMARECGLVVEGYWHFKHLFQPLLRILIDTPLRHILGARRHNLTESSILSKPPAGLKGKLTHLLDGLRTALALCDVMLFGWWLPGGATVWRLRKPIS